MNELTDVQPNKEETKFKTVNDLPIGTYDTIIIALLKNDRWEGKIITNSRIVEIKKKVKINGTTKKIITLNVKEKILIDSKNNKKYNKNTKVWKSFGFKPTKPKKIRSRMK